jgi:SAM-dependent methyltransferase
MRERRQMQREQAKEELYTEYQAGLGGRAGARTPHLRAFVRRHFPADREARILDVGCGTGELLAVLEGEGYRNAWGVDDSPSQVAKACHGSVRRGDGMAALREGGPGSLDVVVTFDVIEHLTREALVEMGREIHRVLRPGGRWIVHAPNAAGIFGGRVRYADLTHELAFTADSMRQLGLLVGFAGARCYEDKPVAHGWKSLLRYVAWQVLRAPVFLLWVAETGSTGPVILSQNLTAVLEK